MGRPNGHKVQKRSLRDTKSGCRDEMRGTKPTQGRGSPGTRSVQGHSLRSCRGLVEGGEGWGLEVVARRSFGGDA